MNSSSRFRRTLIQNEAPLSGDVSEVLLKQRVKHVRYQTIFYKDTVPFILQRVSSSDAG